jgi:hypothetical protein
MQIYGKVRRETEKAILFNIYDQTNELPEAFHGKELWFPLSQCLGGAQRHTDGLRGDAIFAPQYIRVSDFVLLLKAKDLGCYDELKAKFDTEAAARKAAEDEQAAEVAEYLANETADDLRRSIQNTQNSIDDLTAEINRTGRFAAWGPLSKSQIERRRKTMRGYEKNMASYVARLAAKGATDAA